MVLTVKNIGEQVNGVGASVFLAIILIALKLTHHIDWSWVWVLFPLWIGGAVVFLVFLLTLGMMIKNNFKG